MLNRRDFCRLAALGGAVGGTLAAGSLTRLDAQGFTRPAPAPPSPLRILVDPTQTQQEMAGFGASGAFNMAALLQNFPEDERTRILDLLFSTTAGAGLSIVRNIIPAGDPRRPGIEPSEGQWNWSGDADQIWLMREAAKRGCTRFMSTAWSPPAWMKDNNSTVGGHLRPDKYDAYAEYLAQYVLAYKREHNLDIYAISPQNEPDVTVKYASCYWDAAQYHQFVKKSLGPTWRRLNVPAKVILGEDSNWTESLVVPTLEDPDSRDFVDIVASHAYFGDNKVPGVSLTDRIGAFPVARQFHKPIWETEVSAFNANDPGMDDALYWAKLLHFHVAEDFVSGWLYWWLVAAAPNREGLVYLDPQDKAWLANKRLFALGNYSRFARPGAVRVATPANPSPNVYVTAYKQGDEIILVAINGTNTPLSADLAFKDWAPKTAKAYRTSRFEDLSEVGGRAAGPGRFRFPGFEAVTGTGPFTARLIPESVTTIVLS